MSIETTNKKIKIDNGTTFGRTYTDKAIDAKLPTDLIASANKLSLGVGNNALGNGVNLDGFTYDEATKTLKASGGGKLPAGTEDDPLNIGEVKLYNKIPTELIFEQNFIPLIEFDVGKRIPQIHVDSVGSTRRLSLMVDNANFGNSRIHVNYNGARKGDIYTCSLNETEIGLVYSSGTNYQTIGYPTIDGIYNLQLTKTGSSYHYDWVAGGGSGLPTYNHYIVINDTTTANAIYLLIPSTNNLKCNSLTDLDTLLGTAQRFIQASGVVTGNASKLPIVAINWQGSFSSSKIVTMSSEEATTKFTNVVDVVTTL